jgi:hypothetical protein
MERWTSCGWARRSRAHGCEGRLRPEVARRVGWRGRRPRVMMVASTCGAFVQKGGISRISRVRERGQGQRGGLGIPGLCRNRWFSAAGTADSGEQFRQPRGAIWWERRGRMEREMWGSYRRGRGAISAAG